MARRAELEHHRCREQEERAACARAGSEAAREAHFVLAERYADLIWRLEEEA